MGGTGSVFSRRAPAKAQSVSMVVTQNNLEPPCDPPLIHSPPSASTLEGELLLTPAFSAHVTSLDLGNMMAQGAGSDNVVSSSRRSVTGTMLSFDSPREDNTYKSCIPYTPKGEEAEQFKYYCPLCMLHFEHILKTACCKNYICLCCTKDWLKSKSIEHFTLDLLHQHNHDGLRSVHCPHCTSKGFLLERVLQSDVVRDYSLGPVAPSRPLESPLRIGESFEDMKRKMLPYRLPPPTTSSDDAVHGIAIVEDAGVVILSPTSSSSHLADSHDRMQQLNATPLLHVTREAEGKESDGRTIASAKSLPEDLPMSARPYEDDSRRLEASVATPSIKPRGGQEDSVTCHYDSLMGMSGEPDDIEDSKACEVDPDVFNDKLSESGEEVCALEETAMESTSMLFPFQQFDDACHMAQHQVAVAMVSDIFHRALLQQPVMLSQ